MHHLLSLPQAVNVMVFFAQTKQQTSSMIIKLECGPMPNVMAALQNIGGALCSMPQSFADAYY